MGAEGTKGGAVNRPASRHEIEKLERHRCGQCKIEAPKPIVVYTDSGYRCSNTKACNRRACNNATAKRREETKNG